MGQHVFQFGLRPPTTNEAEIRRQLRGAHDYRNALVAIERGRRTALRAIDDTPAVADAIALLRQSTRSTRKQAVTALRQTRKTARSTPEALDELARIKTLEDEITKAAYANAGCAWGTKLDIMAAHRQSRQMPLYGDDAVTPNDPHFVAGPRWRDALPPGDLRDMWWLARGHLAVQLQGGLTSAEAMSGTDTRVRLELRAPDHKGRRWGALSLRVGSDGPGGRDPVWASWPISCPHAVPASAHWKWVRVTCSRDGMRERWTCEVTVDDDAPRPRDLAIRAGGPDAPAGTIAVEWEWTPLGTDGLPGEGGGIRVARYATDTTTDPKGMIVLPEYIAKGIRKPDGIRAVRDLTLNRAVPGIQEALKHAANIPPASSWLREAAGSMHLWRSHDRFRALCMRWAREAPDVAPEGLRVLQAWRARDAHLYYYEVGARGQALDARKDFYRCLAKRWAMTYRYVLLSNQDLSREARFGADADVRFTAGVSELRQAVRNAFGVNDAVDTSWKALRPKGEVIDEDAPDEEEWCEAALRTWLEGGSRGDGVFAALPIKTGNAWAARKAKAKAKKALAVLVA